MESLCIKSQISLHSLTTLELGGKASHFVECQDEASVKHAILWAQDQNLPTFILGGGSNTVISDQGVLGLVIAMRQRGTEITRKDGYTFVTACAGEPWDDFVAFCVASQLSGLECLSGIPGLVGATPIQNVGAYGQEVADVITEVKVLNRNNMQVQVFTKQDCEFGYRTSIFKKQPNQFIVLSVTFALKQEGVPILRYPELQKAITLENPTLSQVREAVLMLRRKKSMVWDKTDENHRSVGSFFLNPILPKKQVEDMVQFALQTKLIAEEKEFPRYQTLQEQMKLSAAWLIEKAGIVKGFRFGCFGVSSRHSLCLVHYGGGQARELIELATLIQKQVLEKFGVRLFPEPIFWGFDKTLDFFS